MILSLKMVNNAMEFWGSIHKTFLELLEKPKNKLQVWGRDINREENSMKVRFTKKIANAIHFYKSMYKKETNSNPSGKTVDGITIMLWTCTWNSMVNHLVLFEVRKSLYNWGLAPHQPA
jgi:hypothetical protein